MEFYRVWAITLRHLRHITHDFSRLTVIFYWPFEEIILWGYSGLWVQQDQGGLSHVGLSLLIGSVLWQITVRANYDISLNLLEEIWSNNVSNLFSTPLKLSEWIGAVILLALVTLGAMILFLSGVVWLLYACSFTQFGWALIPILVGLFLAGLSIGFFAAALLVYWGVRIEALIWSIGWIFAPFSGVYYALDVLPAWAQVVARCLPMSYIFDAIRILIEKNQFPLREVAVSLSLDCVYFALALFFFKMMFEKSRNEGLARLVS